MALVKKEFVPFAELLTELNASLEKVKKLMRVFEVPEASVAVLFDPKGAAAMTVADALEYARHGWHASGQNRAADDVELEKRKALVVKWFDHENLRYQDEDTREAWILWGFTNGNPPIGGLGVPGDVPYVHVDPLLTLFDKVKFYNPNAEPSGK